MKLKLSLADRVDAFILNHFPLVRIRNHLAAFGACVVIGGGIYLSVKSLHLLKVYVFGRFFQPDLKEYGEWAMVCGISEGGIGVGYAWGLAERGLNLILVSRREVALKDVAEQIKVKFPDIELEYLVVDFTGEEFIEQISKKISDRDIGILVNSAGAAPPAHGPFLEIEDALTMRMLRVNVFQVIQLCRLILPKMLKKKKGAIVNISSASAFSPWPLNAVYSSSKAGVDFFIRALAMEYCPKNPKICIQTVRPFFVRTSINPMKLWWPWIPDGMTFGRSAVKVIGMGSETSGYLPHEIEGLEASWFPKLKVWSMEYFSQWYF